LARRGPVTVAEFRATGGTGGGPDKTILFSAARHDPARVRILPCFLQQGGDDMAGIREFAEGAGVEPLFIPDRGPFDLTLVGRMRRLLRERGCRILHAHDFKTDVLGEWIARGVPGVTPLATAHGWSRPLDAKHHLYHVLDRWALRRYPAVIAVSRDTAAKLERAGVDPARVRVVPNGIDLETWTPAAAPAAPPPGLPPGARIVGTVGRLSIDKDMDTLIAAFARVAPRVDNAVLALAGDGPERPRLEALARAGGAADRIFFLGHRGDVRGLYPALSVFVLSSKTEGMPNTLLEAMAMGAPVVANPVGGVAEVATDGEEAIFFPVGDVEALAAALRSLLENPERGRSLARRARLRVEAEFSFTARVRRMESLYEELADRS
jgi:glycosyltransferase involved in cell wall biosynthesis